MLQVPHDGDEYELEKELSLKTPEPSRSESFLHSPKNLKGSGSNLNQRISSQFLSIANTSATNTENFQEIIKEQGALVPMCLTVIRQLQFDIVKYLGDKLTKYTLNDDVKVPIAHLTS